MLLRLTVFIFASLVSMSHSFPTPPPAPSPPMAPPLNSVIQCTPNQARNIRIPPPTLRSCAVALFTLPSFQDMGTFHARGSADPFQLPVQQTYGSCTVNVELAGGRQTETGSWLEVGVAANQLNMACVDADDNPTRMGGWTNSGRTKGVVVTIRETTRSGNWTAVGP